MVPAMKIEATQITQAAGVGAVGTSAFGWLVNVNELLQFVSLAISIVLGIYAIYRIYSKKDDQ